MTKDDYIVRIWPNGTLTMGKVHINENKPEEGSKAYPDRLGVTGRPMFKALESYSNEGSVTKDHVYGYVDYNTSYKHRLATPSEIGVFHLYGLNKKEGEIKQLHRQIILESIV
jgi:hypothetical protein